MEARTGKPPSVPSIQGSLTRQGAALPLSFSFPGAAAVAGGSPRLASTSFSDSTSFVPLTAEEWQVVGHVQEILGTTALRFRRQHERLKTFALVTAAVTGVVAVCVVVDRWHHRRLLTIVQNVFAHAMTSTTAAAQRHRRRSFSTDGSAALGGNDTAVQAIVTATKSAASAATKVVGQAAQAATSVVAQPVKVATEALTMHNQPFPEEDGGGERSAGGGLGWCGGLRNRVCVTFASLLRRVGIRWHPCTATIQELSSSLPAEYVVDRTAATLLPPHGVWTLLVLVGGPMVSVGAFSIGMLHRLGNAKLFEDQLELLHAVCGSAEEGRRREHQRRRRKGWRGRGMEMDDLEEEEDVISARSSGEGKYKDEGALGRRWKWKSFCGEERKAYGRVPDNRSGVDNEE